MRSSVETKGTMVILIVLSMSLFFGEKAFGVAIVGKTLEADGKEFSSSPADQTTELQWSTSPLSLDGNLQESVTDAVNKEDWQGFGSENRQTYLSFADVDRFIPFDEYETEFTGEDFLLFLSVLAVSMLIGTGAGWQFRNAQKKRKKWAHSIQKKWQGSTRKEPVPADFISYDSFHSSDLAD
jgi:hypothetical protein